MIPNLRNSLVRRWQFWWHTIVFSMQQNPPQLIVYSMIGLMAALAGLWIVELKWQYLVLSSSFAIGAAASMSVQEMLFPSHGRSKLILAISMLLIYSLFLFLILADYL
ncbi:MAG TPA: hypothetical protein DCL61_11810 [Cyanobacteria bacterium UBA12227]|nr:hypothetical protein [Cyanobacteria bacterium UBA12227]HAX85787.1 hypothetical protein [Cyanobacteria bacterium UBA11370]HBY79162.1 hypothetical protein [Cyanobacteria bacterium UBA11148]